VVGVAPDPAPRHGVRRGDLIELLPQLEVLDRAALAAPAAGLPVLEPFLHALHQVLGVRHVAYARVLPLPPDPLEGRDRAGERHLVVRRLRRALEEIPTRHAVSRRRLDERGVAARARLRGIVAEAALIGMHQHGDRRPFCHGCTITGMSVCRRISSACETVTLLVRPRVTCAPAKSASHFVRATTFATTSPGDPASMCVTKATPPRDSTASAAPTICTPAAWSDVA